MIGGESRGTFVAAVTTTPSPLLLSCHIPIAGTVLIGVSNPVRVSSVSIPGRFKRFGSLEINSIGPDVDLVVMLGPNGSGKSSVFDAFLQWGRNRGRGARIGIDGHYFESQTGQFSQPEIEIHETNVSGSVGSLVHVRTAHRNTPDVLATSVQRQPDFRGRANIDRMTETDAALTEHYQRLVAKFLPVLSDLESDDSSRDLASIRAQLAVVGDAITRVLPHLKFAGLGDPTVQGSFYFTRGGERQFRFENLSGGEKAAFDILLDVHIAATELGAPLICLDEPEVHLNPAVQASVLTELMRLLPDGSQLWIATHSVGMIRRAFEMSAERPERVAFLNFGQVEGPAPNVRLEPSQPSRKLLREAMGIALNDLAHLLAPEVLVLCEGSQDSERLAAWDERIYRQIFLDKYQSVEFRSIGSKSELDQAASIAAVIAPGTRILKLRDCDDLTTDHRNRMLDEDRDLRILKRRSLESYLLDDEVLDALVSERGSGTTDALERLQNSRDAATKQNGSMKGALGAVFETAKSVLANTAGLGENKHQFGSDVLAKLIVPGMKTHGELIDVLGL